MATLVFNVLLVASAVIMMVIAVGAMSIEYELREHLQLARDRRMWRFITGLQVISMVTGPTMTILQHDSAITEYAVMMLFGTITTITIGLCIAMLHRIKTCLGA